MLVAAKRRRATGRGFGIPGMGRYGVCEFGTGRLGSNLQILLAAQARAAGA